MTSLPSAPALAARICRFLSTNLLDEHIEITDDSPLIELGVDSVSLVQLVLFVESEFGVVLPDAALTPENLETVATLTRCIRTIHREFTT